MITKDTIRKQLKQHYFIAETLPLRPHWSREEVNEALGWIFYYERILEE